MLDRQRNPDLNRTPSADPFNVIPLFTAQQDVADFAPSVQAGINIHNYSPPITISYRFTYAVAAGNPGSGWVATDAADSNPNEAGTIVVSVEDKDHLNALNSLAAVNGLSFSALPQPIKSFIKLVNPADPTSYIDYAITSVTPVVGSPGYYSLGVIPMMWSANVQTQTFVGQGGEVLLVITSKAQMQASRQYVMTFVGSTTPLGTTWPATGSARTVKVILIGGGGSGGAGGNGAASPGGGGGGGGGHWASYTFHSDDLAGVGLQVVIGAGGAAVVGRGSAGTGNAGNAGGDTKLQTLGGGTTILKTFGGAAGSGGLTANGAAAAGGLGGSGAKTIFDGTMHVNSFSGNGGAGGTTTVPEVAGGIAGSGGGFTDIAPGGGGGGGAASVGAFQGGALGGAGGIIQNNAYPITGGASGTTQGNNGGNGLSGGSTTLTPRFAGGAGGGGGAGATAAGAAQGGNGGNGGARGGGGGGGGAKITNGAQFSGNGGAGGDGLAIIIVS